MDLPHRKPDPLQADSTVVRRHTNKVRLAIRVASLLLVLFGPMISGPLARYNWNSRRTTSIASLPPATISPARRAADFPRDTNSSSADALGSVQNYMATRHPAVDFLLPVGWGGTHFFATLDDKHGLAFIHSGAIAISVAALLTGAGEETELHERAHLLHAALPLEVAALIKQLPRPNSGIYAATNSQEHFAEMAASAWRLLAPADDFCWAVGPEERLRDAERQVPGTSGFVLWFLTDDLLAPVEDRAALTATATQLIEATRSEWAPILDFLQRHRLATGAMSQLTPPSHAASLAAHSAELRHSGKIVDKVLGVALLPSTAVAISLERLRTTSQSGTEQP